jgi:hypothetical protein
MQAGQVRSSETAEPERLRGRRAVGSIDTHWRRMRDTARFTQDALGHAHETAWRRDRLMRMRRFWFHFGPKSARGVKSSRCSAVTLLTWASTAKGVRRNLWNVLSPVAVAGQAPSKGAALRRRDGVATTKLLAASLGPRGAATIVSSDCQSAVRGCALRSPSRARPEESAQTQGSWPGRGRRRSSQARQTRF